MRPLSQYADNGWGLAPNMIGCKLSDTDVIVSRLLGKSTCQFCSKQLQVGDYVTKIGGDHTACQFQKIASITGMSVDHVASAFQSVSSGFKNVGTSLEGVMQAIGKATE